MEARLRKLILLLKDYASFLKFYIRRTEEFFMALMQMNSDYQMMLYFTVMDEILIRINCKKMYSSEILYSL